MAMGGLNGTVLWHGSNYLEGVALVLSTVCSLQGCPLRPGGEFWLVFGWFG